MKTTPLAIDLLRIDGDTQSRLGINEDTVSDYCDVIAECNGEWAFPPLDVFYDGTEYFVADGFHRLLAAQRAKRGSIPCKIHKGTARDARIFGMTANDKHGLRLSRAERRANVEWLLDNGGKMTQKAIAESAGVTSRTVKNIVAERNKESIAKKGKVSPSTPTGGGKPPESPVTPEDDPETDETPEDDEVQEEDDQEPDPADLAKKAKQLAHSYRDKLARAICDYHEHVKNRAERDRLVKLVQGVKLW